MARRKVIFESGGMQLVEVKSPADGSLITMARVGDISLGLLADGTIMLVASDGMMNVIADAVDEAAGSGMSGPRPCGGDHEFMAVMG